MITDIEKAISEIANRDLSMIDRLKSYIDLNISIICPDEVLLDSDRRVNVRSSDRLRSSLHFYLSSTLVRAAASNETIPGRYFSAQDAEGWLIGTIKGLSGKTSFMARKSIQLKLQSMFAESDDYARVFNIALSPHIAPNVRGKLRGISAINDIASDHNQNLDISIKRRKIEDLGALYKYIAAFWHELRLEENQRLLGTRGIKERFIINTMEYLADIDALMTDISRIFHKIELFNRRFIDQIPQLRIAGIRHVEIALEPLPAEVIDDLTAL